MAALIVFLGVFRHLVARANPDLDWIAAVMFGTGSTDDV
jgi:hypothetical protein